MAVFTVNPVVGIDFSHYQYGVDVQALLDAGVKVFIVKIGQNSIIDPSFYTHASNVAKFTSQGAILQCYYWDEITVSPATQVTWLTNEIKKSGFPITFTWIDAEQWWNDWTQFYQANNGTLPYSSVAHPTPATLSSHYHATYDALKAVVGADKCGIYTNKSFVDEHATVPTGEVGTSMGTWMGSENVSMWIPYYGYQSQPSVVTVMTWNIWRQQYFPTYTPTIPTGTSYINMRAHQSTGDKCKLPYVYSNAANALSPLDINVLDGAWLASLSGVTPTPVPVPPPSNKYISIYALNIYATSAHVLPTIGILSINTEVMVYEVVGNYARIDTNKWVYMPYLKKVVVPPPSTVVQYKATFNLNIHKTSDSTSPISGILAIGSIVSVYQVVGSYAMIGTEQWVYYPYLQKII